jgi:hypothetical protein
MFRVGQLPGDGTADGSCATNEKDFHVLIVFELQQ